MRILNLLIPFGLIAAMSPFAVAQSTKMTQIQIAHIKNEIPIASLTDPTWNLAKDISVGRYWSSDAAPAERRFTVQLLWSRKALYVRFEAHQAEPLVVSEKPDTAKKIRGLWDRDVCEIFIAPDKNESKKYFEFEIAPTGEWIDLAIDLTSGKRVTDWDYHSGMETSSKVETNRVMMAMKIPWEAFGRKPMPGDVWLGNIFRCVGKDPTRGYLAWQPTMTEKPNFHEPEKFGKFVFEK